ncbi:hypothetical protein Tco_0660778 [Tanacetum coccineum]
MLTKPQFFYDHTTKQALHFQNPFYPKKARQLEPKHYDGNVIKNTSAIVIPDSEETLMFVEESHSKMFLKQKDPMMLEKKVNTTPVNYTVLNQLSQDFKTRFVPQTELSAEQAFWSQNSVNSLDPTPSNRPTKVEVPKELPKVSMVNTSLKKLKHHLAGFDMVRHQYLRDEGLQYTDADIADFEERLGRIYSREIHRVQVVDFQGMPELGVFTGRMLMEHHDDGGAVVFTSQAWRRYYLILGDHVLRSSFFSSIARIDFGKFILALGLHTAEEMELPGFARYWRESERMIPEKGDLHDYWRSISNDGDFLGPPSYT